MSAAPTTAPTSEQEEVMRYMVQDDRQNVVSEFEAADDQDALRRWRAGEGRRAPGDALKRPSDKLGQFVAIIGYPRRETKSYTKRGR